MKAVTSVMTDEVLPGDTNGEDVPAKPATLRKITRTKAPPTTTDLFEHPPDAASSSSSAPTTGSVTADGPVTALDGGEAAGDDHERDAPAGSLPRWPARAGRSVAHHRVTAVWGAVAVALTVALVLTLLALGNRNALDGARTSALSAGRADAVKLAGYDYRHLDRDFSAVLADSTPSFQRSFNQASSALKTTLSKYHATAVAKVVSAGLVSASTSRAVVLVFLTQNIVNSAQSKTSSDRSQVELTLVHSGGRWLIDQVSLL